VAALFISHAHMDRFRFLPPMHFSKSYSGKSHLLYEELKTPPGVTLLRLPEHLTPRPLLTSEIPKLLSGAYED
jgi:ribonuclease Z